MKNFLTNIDQKSSPTNSPPTTYPKKTWGQVLYKILFFIGFSPILLGCVATNETSQKIPIYGKSGPKVDEKNYMSTPCIWDGTILKKKPKVINVP